MPTRASARVSKQRAGNGSVTQDSKPVNGLRSSRRLRGADLEDDPVAIVQAFEQQREPGLPSDMTIDLASAKRLPEGANPNNYDLDSAFSARKLVAS